MSNEITAALIAADLTGQEHSCLTSIIRANVPQSVEQVSASTKLQPLFARRSLRALISRKILCATQSGDSRLYSVNEQVRDWR